MQTELLSDLRGAVQKILEDGDTINDFRKNFDKIVQKHGWSYKGKRGWRSAVIYDTNLRVAQSAGHYKQMSDPDVLRYRP